MTLESLTTDTERSSSSQSLNLTNLSMNYGSNTMVNTVVSKLVQKWRELTKVECSISLFASLLKKNIATRDIFHFVQKQANLRKAFKNLDVPLTKAAMRCKMNDACSLAHRTKRVVNRLKSDLLQATGNKRYLQRKIVKQVRALVTKEKLEQLRKNDIKVSRYEKIQSKMAAEQSQQEFKIPASIDQYKDLKAFNVEQKLEFSPELPMVYDSSISLSQDELSILSKGPKFAVRQQLMEESFRVEV